MINTSYNAHANGANWQNKRWDAKNTASSPTSTAKQTDSVSISDAAKEANDKSNEILAMPRVELTRPSTTSSSLQISTAMKFSKYAWNGTQNAAESATGHKYYTTPGRITKETDDALNAEAKSLGKKISNTLKKAGIEITADDKLDFTIDGNGKIVVNSKGLTGKNRNKAEDIEKALNDVPGLAKELKLNSAGKMVNKRQAAAENAPPGALGVSPSQYGDDDPAMSAAQAELMDDWLQTTLGFGLDDLSAEASVEGWGSGSNGEYYQKLEEYALRGDLGWDEGHGLIDLIGGIMENQSKEGATSHTASFSFQSGDLTDKKDAKKSSETSKTNMTIRLTHHRLQGELQRRQ